MQTDWSEIIQVTEFGQMFSFGVSSIASRGGATIDFIFTEKARGFIITAVFDRKNKYEPYRINVSPEHALSYPHLVEIFNKHLKNVIEQNKKLW